jgi:uncharacterized protein (DUF433 family)
MAEQSIVSFDRCASSAPIIGRAYTPWGTSRREYAMIGSGGSTSKGPNGPSAVTHKKNVCSGMPIVSGTRIPVWVLVRSRQLGIPDSELLLDYPQLNQQQLDAVWEYAERHQSEIDRQIHENEARP